MTIPVHRDTDARICGAATTVAGNSDVFANNLLVSVDGDPNTHGGGALAAHSNQVFADNILSVNHTKDTAAADALCPIPPHCNPDTEQGSPNVFTGDPTGAPTVFIPPVTIEKMETRIKVYIAEPYDPADYPPQLPAPVEIDTEEQVEIEFIPTPDEILEEEPPIEGAALEQPEAKTHEDICHPFDGVLDQYLLESSQDLWDETGMKAKYIGTYPNGAYEKPSNPKILNIWDDIGFRGSKVWETDQTPWCMGFINHVLKKSGYKYVQTARAFDIRDKMAKYEATEVSFEDAKCGDIALWKFSHVNFIYSNEDGRMSFVGGNQSDKARNDNNPSGGAVTHSWKGTAPSPMNPNGKEGGKGAYYYNGTRHDTNLIKVYRPKKIA